MTLGPRTLKAIAEESPFADIGTPWHETRQALARRVALIAVEEERERCAKVLGNWCLIPDNADKAARWNKAGGVMNAISGAMNDAWSAIREGR